MPFASDPKVKTQSLSLTPREETETFSRTETLLGLPISRATRAAFDTRIAASANEKPASFPKTLYQFAAHETDTDPIRIGSGPTSEPGLQSVLRPGSKSSPASMNAKELRELWTLSRQRLAVSSTLHRAVDTILDEGATSGRVTEQPQSIAQQIAFLGHTWTDGVSLDAQVAARSQ